MSRGSDYRCPNCGQNRFFLRQTFELLNGKHIETERSSTQITCNRCYYTSNEAEFKEAQYAY